jgi:NhaP-type Na+/H+ or K+/H+ antiporter
MALAGIIILSFFFNIISKKTNIPSVLLLILLGMGLKIGLKSAGIFKDVELDSILEILGNVGLVMIVLEAALDLKLEKEKTGMIFKAFLVALLGIGGSMFALGAFFVYIFPSAGWYTAILYAIPLSIMSSAIIIPSVGGLRGLKKEFMVYESTFSDILGIMVFYFMLGADGHAGGLKHIGNNGSFCYCCLCDGLPFSALANAGKTVSNYCCFTASFCGWKILPLIFIANYSGLWNGAQQHRCLFPRLP